jgi:hypothetical protein
MKEMRSKNKSHIKSKIFTERGILNLDKTQNFILNSYSVTSQQINKPSIKINSKIFITKQKFKYFEFYSNQDPVILTEKFCCNNQLYDITKFRKEDILNQIKEEINYAIKNNNNNINN